jgi:hypothetical protein
MDAVNAEDWDYITVQQGSVDSGVPSTYDDLTPILNAIMKARPEATVMWNMTWAYQQDYSNATSFAPYNNDQTTMYQGIVDSVKSKIVPDLEINSVIPNGTAIQNARTSWLGDTLTRDGLHLGSVGQYIAALSYAYLMTGRDITTVDFAPGNMGEKLKELCFESVMNAIKRPFYVTQSSFARKSNLSATHVELSDYGWQNGYWFSTDPENYHNRLDTEVNPPRYISTKVFGKADLPVGTIIEIASGYKYRPEAWTGTGVQTARPENVSTYRIVVNEEWWGKYDYRAFNISATETATLDASAAQAAFKIWLPK